MPRDQYSTVSAVVSAEPVWLKLYSIVLFADRRDILMIFDYYYYYTGIR